MVFPHFNAETSLPRHGEEAHSLSDKLSKIKLLAMDVDGTLTDGTMTFVNGEQIKSFSVYDGLGIRLAINHGLGIAWITGNRSDAVAERAEMLGVKDVFQGARFKSEAMAETARRHGLSLDEIAYIGDDLNDLPAFERAGYAFAVGNSADEVKSAADCVTTRRGGEGAVREAIETILKASGEWEEAMKGFLDELRKEQPQAGGPEAVA